MKTVNLRIAIVAGVLAALPIAAGYAHDTPQQAANKKLVVEFYKVLDTKFASPEERSKATESFIHKDYIQHSSWASGRPGGPAPGAQAGAPPGGPPGGAPPGAGGPPGSGGAAPPAGIPAELFRPGSGLPPATTMAVMADDQDRVIIVTSRKYTESSTGKERVNMVWNMFRVKDGKLIEHWDAAGTPLN